MRVFVRTPRTLRPKRRSALSVAVVLALALAPAGPGFADQRSAQSVKAAGVTFNFAQVLDWIGVGVFAVGRWDGTISVFRVPGPNEFGPMILQAMSTSSGRGIEMLAAADDQSFFTSDGPNRLALWRRKSVGSPFELAASPSYDMAAGVANSGLALNANGNDYFASGHEGGRVLIWRREADGNYQLANTVDVRSPNTPSNPWMLRNVRGLGAWRGDRLISGSEDGDLVAISVPDGRELFRHRYNAAAQRGINALSIVGETLAVANCAVGQADKNIWLFDLANDRPSLVDAENLALDTGRAQIFNFDVDLISVPGKAGAPPTLTFFSSTEEGLIWEGRIEDGQLTVTGVTRVSPEGGAVMAVAPKGDLVAAAAHAIRLFKTD
ncbi:MAG: hypothetical protein QOD89_2956 [Bradyrhizobium sp.]|jgi:hypothetical protein|nr:hypothetical protein [Bradyrhizobium sp.]